MRPGSGETVHPATTDGNRKGADSGVKAHRMISPPFTFLLPGCCPHAPLRVNYIIRPFDSEARPQHCEARIIDTVNE